jgi:branched-chain amino acid transport system permease protein
MSTVNQTVPAATAELDMPVQHAVRTGLNRRSVLIGLGIALGVFLLGLLTMSALTSVYYQGILVSGAILGMVALSIGFLAHRSGLISLGQTAFYGGAAYLVAISTTTWGWSPLAAGALGFFGAIVLAIIIGALCVRTPGMSFVMLTLAFGQALYQFVILDSVRGTTGAFDGLSVTFQPGTTFLGLSQSDIATPSKVWPLVWGCLVVVAVVLWLAGRSRFGTLLEGIRENEERARFSGYNTYLPRLAAFTLSGAAAGIAGVLFAFTSAYVSPDVLTFATAGNALIATIVGGVGTLAGPVVGAMLYVYGQNKLSSSGSDIDFYTGIALIIVLVFLPGGVVGSLGRLFRLARTRVRGGSSS